MLGSASEAEDAVQETMIRAWRAFDRFEGRSSLRSWLYRIATNVCLDMLGGSAAAGPPDGPRPQRGAAERRRSEQRAEVTWSSPVPDAWCSPTATRPRPAVDRESIRLAFVAALQHLPPRQRAVLILREVLRWQADEVAELLETTVASVNSALQRARATLGRRATSTAPIRRRRPTTASRRCSTATSTPSSATTWPRSSACCRDDATMSMPPYDLWLQGRDEIERLAARTGRRVPRLAARAGGGERLARLRAVPATAGRVVRRRGR